MPLLLLSPRFSEDSIRLAREVEGPGIDVLRLPSFRVPDEFRGRDDVCVYAEPLFAAHVAEELGFALLEPTFEWVAMLPRHHVSRRIRLTTLGEARTLTETAFVKPADDKSFPAGVFADGPSIPASPLLDPETAVLVSDPVSFVLEVRCFVRDRAVVAHSVYARDGELAREQDGAYTLAEEETRAALTFARGVLDDSEVRLPPACVLDVGRLAGAGYAVVEANPVFASGLYGADVAGALRAIARASVPHPRVTDDDRPWILARAGA